MSRDKASLLDIVNAAQRVIQFAEGLEKSDLENNEEKQSAILYQIIVMGEATKRLSTEFRAQYPQIPWREIAGMRDILAHQYDRINFNPKAEKGKQGDRYFVQVRAKFIPKLNTWGFVEQIEPPSKDYPKFLKPRKEDKAAVLAAKAKAAR
jgi:uncharacterized protein with HEPN domain